MTLREVKDKKIIILSHYGATGACEELRDWLKDIGIRELVYVSFPFGTNQDRFIRITAVRQGETQEIPVRRLRMAEPLAYIRDFICAFGFALKYGRHADVLVAGDNLLAWAGVLVRHCAGIKSVVFYMIDYTPVRFKNPIINRLYYLIDRFAAYGADEVWPLNASMIQARAAAGRLMLDRVRWRVVPYGSHVPDAPAQTSYRRERVVFVGEVSKSKGADLLVPMVVALRRLIPEVKLSIIGGGAALLQLREAVEKAGLQDCFEIYGFVESISDVLALLLTAGVAIAPYYPFDGNTFTQFADPGKLKLYLGCSLPVVLTGVPPISKRIESEGAGLIAEYDAADFADKIAGIIQSGEYEDFRARARRLGEAYVWPRVFAKAFEGLDAKSKEDAHE